MPGSVHDPVSRTSYEFTPRRRDLTVETWMEPGGGLPPHEHPRQTEVWYAIDGKVEFRLGKEKRVIGPEDGEMVVPPQHGPRRQGRGGPHRAPGLPRHARARRSRASSRRAPPRPTTACS